MRHKNATWDIPARVTWEQATYAALLDVRDELQTLNAVFRCSNFLGIPGTLTRIEKQLSAQRRCRKHPKYTGRLRPRVNCVECRRFYNAAWK